MDLLISYITWAPSEEIFRIGFVAVRWYGVLFGLGFFIGYLIMNKIYIAEGKTQKELDQLALTMVISTIVGARLGHCLFYDPVYFLSNPIEILKVWQGGLASHGAAIGIIVALWLLTKDNKRISFLWILDRIVIVIALAGFFIRLGNFFNSEIYGTETNLPWGVIFSSKDSLNLVRHPVQLYEGFSYLLIFVFLYLRYNKFKDKTKSGELFGWFLTLVFGFRFIWEFFKAKQTDILQSFPLEMGQLLSIPFIIIGIYFLQRSQVFTKK